MASSTLTSSVSAAVSARGLASVLVVLLGLVIVLGLVISPGAVAG